MSIGAPSADRSRLDMTMSLRLCGGINNAHVRSDHAPAFRKTHPGLHLPPDLASGAMKQRRGDGEIPAVCGDDSLGTRACQADRRAGGAERLDSFGSVQVLAHPVAQRARIVAEEA